VKISTARTNPTIAQVFALADAFTDRRSRLLILLGVFCSLRWGELAALARSISERVRAELRPSGTQRAGPKGKRSRQRRR
jgi:hypothetical protein